MENLTKVVRIGRGHSGNVFCKIEFNKGRLSITGVEGPMRNGDAKGSCGQIDMHTWGITEYAPGWNAETESEFRDVWGRWHLNDMRAGNAAQEDWLRANPVEAKYPESHYEKASEALRVAGLNPDNGYKYDHAWKCEIVPDDVIAWLAALPDSDMTPAWI